MANKALKGLTIKIGGDTSDLLKSLDDVDKRSRSLSSELGQINKLLKLDPKNTELLAQKQKVLADAISNTEERLGTLKEAEKQAQKQFEKGEISEAQYRALQREIIATEAKLDKYKSAAKEAAEASEKLADGADEAARELDDQADKAKEAADANEDLDDAAGDLAKGGLTALAGAAVAATTAIVALAEETREYRTAMNRLDVAFQDAGFSAETATQTYEELQSILGETDQAVEASNLLAKFCDTEEELKEMTHALTGVYATFPDSLPIEALAESANETARTGQIAGNLADALNWAAAEGETFGVTLKKNTKFTELSKKELDGLTESQKAEYEARKKQHDEIEEYNKSVEEAASAEDMFNIALANCADEQERQQLIAKTLTDLYGDAATQYKKTNEEVIRSNQATEKWNEETAKIGETVEPVMTDLKELGVALLEDAEEPIEDTADFIRNKLIPAIQDVSSWTKKNLPAIKGGLVGVATAMVAFKTASIATTVAQKGLKKSIMATTVAQKALNLVQKASPAGALLLAVTAVTAGIVAYTAATKKAEKPVDILTEEERELMKAADEAAEAFREQKEATDEALANTTAQMGYVQDLADELQDLADASGKVKESDQERADFILNELNSALGTEYEMVDGVIQKYTDLKESIDLVIRSKTASSLIEAANADYVAAIQNEAAALENLNLKEQDYQNQKIAVQQAEEEYLKWKEIYNQALQDGDYKTAQFAQANLANADVNLQKEKGLLEEKKTAYDQAATDYASYYNTIATYEEAQAAALSGNYEKAVDLLARKGGAYGTYSDKVDEETRKVLDTLFKEAIDAGLEAERTKRNFENGVDGYTEEMVKEAEKNYEKAMGEFENAYADAEGVGEDLTDGMTAGAENNRASLLEKARSLVSGFLAAAREAADSHSPSRKAIKIFEDIGEGAEIGVENKTPDVAKAGAKQASAILDAYSAQELAGQRALRSVADQQAARQATIQTAATASHASMLEKILAAIQEGQVLALDGDTLVGATANRMDTALGQRRTLASRGAL